MDNAVEEGTLQGALRLGREPSCLTEGATHRQGVERSFVVPAVPLDYGFHNVEVPKNTGNVSATIADEVAQGGVHLHQHSARKRGAVHPFVVAVEVAALLG